MCRICPVGCVEQAAHLTEQRALSAPLSRLCGARLPQLPSACLPLQLLAPAVFPQGVGLTELPHELLDKSQLTRLDLMVNQLEVSRLLPGTLTRSTRAFARHGLLWCAAVKAGNPASGCSTVLSPTQAGPARGTLPGQHALHAPGQQPFSALPFSAAHGQQGAVGGDALLCSPLRWATRCAPQLSLLRGRSRLAPTQLPHCTPGIFTRTQPCCTPSAHCSLAAGGCVPGQPEWRGLGRGQRPLLSKLRLLQRLPSAPRARRHAAAGAV